MKSKDIIIGGDYEVRLGYRGPQRATVLGLATTRQFVGRKEGTGEPIFKDEPRPGYFRVRGEVVRQLRHGVSPETVAMTVRPQDILRPWTAEVEEERAAARRLEEEVEAARQRVKTLVAEVRVQLDGLGFPGPEGDRARPGRRPEREVCFDTEAGLRWLADVLAAYSMGAIYLPEEGMAERSGRCWLASNIYLPEEGADDDF